MNPVHAPRDVLPAETARAFELVAPVVPPGAYLVGGTALALHLAHRVSRDLDFFLSEPVDIEAVLSRLRRIGDFFVELVTDDTLNGVLHETRIQLLQAHDQRVLEPFARVAGVDVAGVGDLLATKLNAVVGRATMRDYFDLMVLETRGRRLVDEGLGLAIAKYRPRSPEHYVDSVVRALGYLGDVDDDPQLPVGREAIETYWQRRQPEVVRNMGRGSSGG